MKKLVAALGLVWTVGGLLAAPGPLWELPAAKRGMELSRATAFDVPQAVAIPDHTAFTVELELGLDKPPTVFYQPLPLLDEEIGGTGFALCLRSYQPQGAAVSLGLFMRLNGLNYEVRLSPFDAGEPLKLRVKFRKGFVVVSECHGEKWQMLKSYLRIVSPNERPIRVGDAKSCPPDASRPDLRGARLESLRFWGSDYEVFAPNEDRKPAAGVLSGEGFTMDVPVEEREERKRLLYVGDSISGGYSRFLVQLLGDRAYPYHWWSFWGGAKPPVVSPDALKKPLSYRAYDMIVFNNGLHSLNWDEATATDGEIRAHYASLVEAFRANCPKARLVYMNTTPWGRLRGPQGGYVTGGRKNDVVRRLNRIADEVMREKKVEVLDAYALMSANLQHLYGDDDCHYRDEGYRLIARMIADCFEERPTTTAEFEIRDPFILREGGTYYCYFSKSWFGGREVKVRTSTDLENWSEAKVVLRVKEEWSVSAVWAPEVHRFNGRYYLFATLHCNDGKHRKTGTWVFAADRPEGPFEPTKDDALTPEGTSIDGTPVADSDGTPWMVYCSAVADRDCSMMAVRLNADFSGTEGEPVALFDWKALRGHLKKSGVSEGAAFYRSKGGRLFMTWSNVSCWGYCVALAVSDSGRVTGPWRQLGIPIRIDGGHGAFFTRTDGSLAFALHAPNSSGSFERMVFADVEDRGEALDFRLRLPIVDRWCGGTREIFDFHGLTAWVVTPDRVAPGRPWTWSLHWNGAFYDRTGAQDLVRQGYLHAALDVADLDDEKALAELAAFQDHLVGTRGFAPQANLIGMDRGAALAQAYAAAHPSSVRAMFLDDGQTATFVRDGREKKVVLGERPYPGLDGKDMHLLMETFK